MAKKISGILAIACVIASFLMMTGCGIKDGDGGTAAAYEKIHKKLIDLESFEAEATVTYISNKTSHTYETWQQCRMTGEYRIEVTGPERVAGNVTVCDGKFISQYNTRIAGKISLGTTEATERVEILLTSFIRNYVRSQEVPVEAASIDGEACTVLEAVIPGEHPYLRTERLWVDNITLKPVKLVIYDPGGGERIVVSFKSFEYNVMLKDDIFKVE